MRTETEGRYDASGTSSVGTAITFLLIGLGAGALIGMMYAPKAGKQMRKDLRRRYDEARETIDDWTEQARDVAEDVMERSSDLADDLRERVAPLGKKMRRS